MHCTFMGVKLLTVRLYTHSHGSSDRKAAVLRFICMPMHRRRFGSKRIQVVLFIQSSISKVLKDHIWFYIIFCRFLE